MDTKKLEVSLQSFNPIRELTGILKQNSSETMGDIEEYFRKFTSEIEAFLSIEQQIKIQDAILSLENGLNEYLMKSSNFIYDQFQGPIEKLVKDVHEIIMVLQE